MAPLIGALRSLGARVDYPARLPLTVHGIGRVTGGQVTIDASASSQLVSGLLLAARDSTGGSPCGTPARPSPARRTCG